MDNFPNTESAVETDAVLPGELTVQDLPKKLPPVVEEDYLPENVAQDPKVVKAMALLASFRELEKFGNETDGIPNYIGRYRIIESAGRGGFSEVFRAIDEDLSRDVALKIPLIVGRPDCQVRFEREARLAAMPPICNLPSSFVFAHGPSTSSQ